MEIRYLRKVDVVGMDNEQTEGIRRRLGVEVVLNVVERNRVEDSRK